MQKSMWLSIALVGYTCLAVVSILDKFILSSEKVRPIVFVFFSTIFFVPVTLYLPFIWQNLDFKTLLIITTSALTSVFSLWAMYRSFQKSEVSHIGPLIGAATPLVILVLSRVFLLEKISTLQFFGIIFLSLGTFIISYQKNLGSDLKRGISWAIFSAVLFSVFLVSAKYTYSVIGFKNGVVYIWGFVGVVGLLLLFSKVVRDAVLPHHNLPVLIAKKIFHRGDKPARQKMLIAADKILGALGALLIQYAVSLGSVTQVNALAGFQQGLLVILVLILSSFFPKFFKEKYDEGELGRELFAVAVIAVGLIFLVK